MDACVHVYVYKQNLNTSPPPHLMLGLIKPIAPENKKEIKAVIKQQNY